jgi:hypothetical protein
MMHITWGWSLHNIYDLSAMLIFYDQPRPRETRTLQEMEMENPIK